MNNNLLNNIKIAINEKKNSLKNLLFQYLSPTEFVNKSYEEYKGDKAPKNGTSLPLVSIIMTAYNAEKTIENSINSLLSQSYQNLEIIICDDSSTDKTHEILLSIAKKDKRVQVYHLETNSGTYLAKNVAIAHSKGEIILFQDSDDYSHKERVMVQVLPFLNDENLLITRTRYVRFDANTGIIIPQGEHISKYTYITLAIKRNVFDKIGYFDAVRKAGDDEFYQRFVHFLGRKYIKLLDVTLYMGGIHNNNLTIDSLFIENGVANWRISEDRKKYLEYFQKRIQEKPLEWFKSTMTPYPAKVDYSFDQKISAFSNKKDPVIISMCSIPSRVNHLISVVEKLKNQADRIILYLDKYESVPQELINIKNVQILRSQDYNVDFRDHAKFLMFNELKKEFSNFYFITCDDDIIYPYDYVNTLLTQLESYNNNIAVGIHGVTCPEVPKNYYKERLNTFLFSKGFNKSTLVNVLGTGTLAFHSKLFNSIDPNEWGNGGMADIFFAIKGQENNVPFLCLKRKAGWLKSITTEVTLYEEFQKKEAIIYEKLKDKKWGYVSIMRILLLQEIDIIDKLRKCLPQVN